MPSDFIGIAALMLLYSAMIENEEKGYSTDEERFSEEEEDWDEEPSTSSARKRGHDEVGPDGDEDEQDDNDEDEDEPAQKRTRVEDNAVVRHRNIGAQSGPSSQHVERRPRHSHLDPPSPGRPDPYQTLPPPSDHWIQLRLQLCRFKGVYRIVRFPLNYTFVTLYKFLMFSFGWSGDHLHEFNVLSNVEMYATRPGEIKKWSQPLPEQPDPDDREAYMQWTYHYFRDKDPIMRIVPWSVRGGRGRGFEVEEFTQVLEDHTTTLGDVWNKTTRKNAAKGECGNKDIAIKFVYDFGDEWEVHISIDCTKDGHYIFHGEPRDYPEVMVAKGAPPIEHASDLLPGEVANKKKVSPLLFKTDTFAQFVAGTVGSVTRKTELAIYNIEEERARREAARQAQHA